MRYLLIALSLLLFSVSAASAHCGKPHPEAKDKTQTSRPIPSPK